MRNKLKIKMQYIKLKEDLKKYTVFSLKDIKKIDQKFGRARLNEWQKKGYIKKIIKNFYIFTDIMPDEHYLFEIANRIYPPSYVSMETALSYYNLIPESVYTVTSVSTRRTYTFDAEIGQFIYRKIKPSIFFGYKLLEYGDKKIKIASIEKTILDFLYLNPRINSLSTMESIRLNKEEFLDNADKNKLNDYLALFNNKQLSKRIKVFWGYIYNA